MHLLLLLLPLRHAGSRPFQCRHQSARVEEVQQLVRVTIAGLALSDKISMECAMTAATAEACSATA